jgi:hypothetical protein
MTPEEMERRLRTHTAQFESTNQSLSDFNSRVRTLEQAVVAIQKKRKDQNDWPVVTLIAVLMFCIALIVVGIAWTVTR